MRSLLTTFCCMLILTACSGTSACPDQQKISAIEAVTEDMASLMDGQKIDRQAFLKKIGDLEAAEGVPPEKSGVPVFASIITVDGGLNPAYRTAVQTANMQLNNRLYSLHMSCKGL